MQQLKGLSWHLQSFPAPMEKTGQDAIKNSASESTKLDIQLLVTFLRAGLLKGVPAHDRGVEMDEL